jgi:hypothetical protein
MCEWYHNIYACRHDDYGKGRFCRDGAMRQKWCAEKEDEKKIIWHTLRLPEMCKECHVANDVVPRSVKVRRGKKKA